MAVAPTQETVNKLLDFNQKLDIGLLDTVVGTLYSGTGDQQKMAQEVLTTLKEHPDAWTKVRFLNFSSTIYNILIYVDFRLTRFWNFPQINRQSIMLCKSWRV